MKVLRQLAMDLATGPDGVTFAIGRILGILLFLFGLGAPTMVAVNLIVTQNPPMSDWVGFLNALAIYIPALMGGVVLLVAGSNFTEPLDPDRIRALNPQNGTGGGGMVFPAPGYDAWRGSRDPAPRLDLPS